jgi:hypothetical protein
MFARLPSIDKDGKIVIPGKHTIPFSTYEALNKVCRPIMREFGFSMRHRHRMENGLVVTTGILTHRLGHFEEDEFAAAPDQSGSKNTIQAVGSTRQYGRRYTMISLLNIVTYEKGHDGETPGEPESEDRPVPGRRGPYYEDLGQIGYNAPPPPPTSTHADQRKTISEAYQKRLHRIFAQTRGAAKRPELKAWLLKEWGYGSTKDIKVQDYDEIIAFIEAPGPLATPRR